MSNIPVGSTCTVTEGAKPPVTHYTWGAEQVTNPAAPMAAGGTLAASIANSLTRDQVSVTINKTVTGAPAAGAPGSYGFSLVCDTGTYTGAVSIAANGVSGSATVQVPQGALCSALNETSKAAPPADHTWAAESTTTPAGAIAAGATGSIVNPLKTNAKVTLQKTGPRIALTGEQFNYTLTLTNTGELPTAGALMVQDLLPEGMEFVAAQGDICTGAASDKQTLLTCTVPGPLTEAGGSMPSTTFTVTVKAPATAGALINYAATHPGGSGNPPSPPGAACDVATTSCANWATEVNTPAALTVEKSAPTISAAGGLNQYTASYQLTVRNTGGSEGSYTLSDTPGFASSATLTSINAQSAGGGVLGGAFPINNPANGAAQQIGASSLPIAAGATHTYTVTIDYTMVGGSALACSGSAGNGAFNTASITGTTAASANACGDLTGQATAGITLKKAWNNGKSGDAVTLAISGSGVTGAVGGSSAVSGAVVDATATAIVGSTVAIAESWTAGNSANYDVAYSCDNGIGAATSFTMPNAAVTCTVTNTRKSAQLKLAKQWINGTSGDTVNITATYNGTTASIISTAGNADKTDTGTNAASVYAGDVLTLPEEVFSNPDNAAKYTKTVSCSAGSLAGKDLTVPAGAPELLCTYKNSGLPQVSATKAAEPAALIKGASGQKYVITVTVAGAPTTDVITIADALPSGIKLAGAPTVEAGTGTSVPKLEACGAAGDTSLGANCALSGTTGVTLNLGTYIITIPIDTSDATVGATAGNNTAHLSGGGDPACKLDGNPLACNPSTEDVPVNTPAALLVAKTNGVNQLTAGTQATYTVTITNTGGTAASGVEWRDVVGSGLLDIASVAPVAASAGSDLGTCAGLACTGITVAANGGSVSYTVTGTVGAAAPGARAVNTANVVGGGCVAGAGTDPSTPASCTATDSDPIEPVPPVVVDPPFITKAAAQGSDGHVKWIIVLDNPNPAAMVVQMRDPMPEGMTFVSGSVSCAANGASTVVAPPAGCYYDQANNRLVVDATLAPDNGTATGANRVEVVFEAQFVATPAPVTNTAQACWDTQNDSAGIHACTASLSAAATYTPGPKPPAVPAPVPVDSRTMLLLLAVLLMLAAGWQSRSGRR